MGVVMNRGAIATRALGRLGAALALCALAGVAQAEVRSYVTEIPTLLEQSPASDWESIPDEDLMVLELANGTVVVELASFAAPAHVAQWRALVDSGYFDASSVVRAQENYVVQWGETTGARSPGAAGAPLPKEATFAFSTQAARFVPLGAVDSYAAEVGFIDGFPVGLDHERAQAWVLHCHGAIGTVQADPQTTPGGVYYYTAIGNPARELDGRIAVVGRVIDGIDALSTLPRGQGVYGFLDEAAYVPIRTTRLASRLPPGERPGYERLRGDSDTFASLLRLRAAARAKGAPEGAPYPIDACSVPLPVRTR